MALILTEEEQMVKASAKELFKARSPISQLRKLRDTKDVLGYEQSLWTEMANMGFCGLTIPESLGGLGFGYVGLGQVLEESGRTLTASPLVSTILLSATAIRLGGNQIQKEQYLPSIAEGKLLMSLAVDEGTHHDPASCKTTISNDQKITGTKTVVLDGHIAQKILVSAKNGDGKLSLYIVSTDSDGVEIQRDTMMDSRNMAKIKLNQVAVEGCLEDYNGTSTLLDDVLDIGRIGLSAEMLGSTMEAFERTMNYISERTQFGVRIGSFQALQHRAAILFGEIELCKSIVIKSLQAIDHNSGDLAYLASLAKAKLGETFREMSNEGIQMYGGIGMTDDEEIGFFLKRARVVQQTLGDTNFHLDRLAKMKKF